MENIKKYIDLLQKRQIIRNEQFRNEEHQQITEYSNLLNTLQALKDERNSCKENITNNLQRFGRHKHSIYKLIHSSENISGLPVSHNYHRQTIAFLHEGIDFMNKSHNVYKNIESDSEDKNMNSTNLVQNITSCTTSIGTELYKIKSLITEVNTLQNNIEIIQPFLRNDNDMDLE